LQSYSSLPANSEENSHYEYAYSHQETDATGYLKLSVLNTDDTTMKDTDDVKYETIKDSTNYVDLIT